MLEIIIPANAKWEDIFQYYTGQKITLTDIQNFIEKEYSVKKQKGGIVPGGRWIIDAVGRLVSVATPAAEGAAEGAAAGAVAGPAGAAAGAVVGAVARTVIQEALVEGTAAVLSMAAGPAAPVAQRTIATGIRVGVAAVSILVGAWYLYNPGEEAIAIGTEGGGTVDTNLAEQIEQVKPIIDLLKKKMGSDFDIMIEVIQMELRRGHSNIPRRVFSFKDIMTAISVSTVLTNKESFKNTKSNTTRKNNKSRGARR